MRVGRLELLPLYLRPEQKTSLKQLSKRTNIPQQVYLREAVDMLLQKYQKEAKQ